MHIVTRYKVNQVADENIIFIQGRNAGDMSTVIALNSTSLFLWNSLYGREFDEDDAVNLLMQEFDVDHSVALNDARGFINTLKEHKVVE